MAIVVLCYEKDLGKFFGQLIGSAQIEAGAIISGKIAANAIGDGHIVDLAATKLTGLLPPARISGLPYANLALSGRLADADILSGITANKLLSGYFGFKVASGYSAVGLTGQLPQARISGLFVSGLLLSGAIQPDDFRFLTGMLARPTPAGCVLDLDMNEGAGGMAYDKSGLNNDGIIYGATWADGLFGKCLSLDGLDDRVDCGNDKSLQISGYYLTIEAWVYPHDIARSGEIACKTDSVDWDNTGFQFRHLANTGLDVRINTTAGVVGSYEYPPLVQGIWQHVVVVFNSVEMAFYVYVNGSLKYTRSWTGVVPTLVPSTTNPLFIGKRGANDVYWDGLIDEVRIYARALSADEIRGRYIQGLAKLGKLQGSVRLFNSGWTPKIHFDPESADLQVMSGAIRTSGLVYAGTQQVQVTTPAGYITSAFTSGWMGYPRLHSGLVNPQLLIDVPMISGFFTSGMHDFVHPTGLIPDLDAAKIITGIFPPARISGLPYANLALSGRLVDADILSGITAQKLLSGYFGFKVASGYPVDGLVGLIPPARISGLPYGNLYLTNAVVDEDIVGLAASKLTGLLPLARLSGIGTGQIANQGILSASIGANILATPHMQNQGMLSAAIGLLAVGDPHVYDLAATKLTGLIAPARISGLPYANLYLLNSIVDGDIASGLNAGKLIGTMPALPLSGRSLADLGTRTHSLLQSIGADDHHIQFTSGMHSFVHPVGLIPDLDTTKITTGIFPPTRISGLPYANLALSGRLTDFDILSGITAAKILSGYSGLDGTSGYVLTARGPGVLPVHAAITRLPTIIRKAVDETVNASSTLQNDDELLFTMAANEVWEICIILLNISATTYPDMQIGFSLPSGATLHGWCWRLETDGTTYSYFKIAETDTITFCAGTAISNNIQVRAIVINGANAGNFQLQWSQRLSTAENTTVKANSCIIAHKLA